MPNRRPLHHPVGPVRSLASRSRGHPQGRGRGGLQPRRIEVPAGGAELQRRPCSFRQSAEDRQCRAPRIPQRTTMS
jgi:hypothetical protein